MLRFIFELTERSRTQFRMPSINSTFYVLSELWAPRVINQLPYERLSLVFYSSMERNFYPLFRTRIVTP
jgi:hypothetical protein